MHTGVAVERFTPAPRREKGNGGGIERQKLFQNLPESVL